MKIHTTADTKELNEAIEAFDNLTHFRFDRSPLAIIEMEASQMLRDFAALRVNLEQFQTIARIVRVLRKNMPMRIFVNSCLDPDSFK